MADEIKTSRPSNGPATTKDVAYLLRDIDELKQKIAGKDYVDAKDNALDELINSRLGDVDVMKRFIVAALIALAGLMLGGGGAIVWRAACLNGQVTQTTTELKTLSTDFKDHVKAQQVERIEDIVTLNSKLSFMEQRLMNALAKITQGKSLAPPSSEEYMQLRKSQVLKDIERLELSTGVKIPAATKNAIAASVKDDVSLLPKAVLRENK